MMMVRPSASSLRHLCKRLGVFELHAPGCDFVDNVFFPSARGRRESRPRGLWELPQVFYRESRHSDFASHRSN